MNGRILRRKGGRFSVLDLDPAILARINSLGQEFYARLKSQDPAVWAQADPEMLPRLVGGAIVLQRMAPTGKDKAILLHDDGAQMALQTCCTMCVAPKSFDSEMRIILEDTLNVIARCCPYEIAMEPLPSLSDLPETYQTNQDVLEQYKAFPTDDKPIGLREVMLFDALILFRIFAQVPHPPVALMGRLETITAGFRLSIRRLRNAAG